eukprot:CAMPEP_0197026010 /NCGR_PEP_ID=MMETSP1384-20130603/6198_1 /TAXON_ID=29189 /ORGANISM="Ammonia sp." /LENGTH=950 /DNA_ID=CAMNT_0042454611 /DNA_START=158 /DNA_END=3010 /DNA_ORIENTATION=+
MKSFATICSLLWTLIYVASAQQCSNTHSQRLLISVSINGRSVDKIGRSTYLSAVSSAVDTILPSSGTQSALYTFGGVTNPSSTITQITSLGSNTYATLDSAITGLESSAAWDSNLGNAVSDAIDNAETLIGSATGAQKYHIIFAAGNPLANGFGDTTSPQNPDDPCPTAITSKAAGIQTFVVLVGEDGYNFVKEYYQCIGESVDDVIVMDPAATSTALTSLGTKMCKTGGIDLKITEINIAATTSGEAQFVEILNRGATASIRACLGGSSCSTASSTGTGSYYVGYTGSATTYTATAQVSGTTYDTVAYIPGSNGFENPLTGRSLELRNIGFDNDFGANWRQACYGVYETAGSAPADDCTATSGSCGTGGTTSATCNINDGFTTIQCATSSTYCLCTAAALGNWDTCSDLAVPTTCQAYILPWETTSGPVDYLYLAFDKIDFDAALSYSVSYFDATGQPADSTAVRSPVVATPDFSRDYVNHASGTDTITVTVLYTGPASRNYEVTSSAITCSAITLEPTAHPTVSPTNFPTTDPTKEPTPSPTFDQPGVVLDDVCGPFRCKCFGTPRSCCLPFGPGQTPAYTPSAGCEEVTKILTIEESNQYDFAEEVVFAVYPESFLQSITVEYSVKAYGEINISEFTNLTWAGSYMTDGTITGITTRRRLFDFKQAAIEEHEAKLAQRQRRLLQTTPSPVTPAPTTATSSTAASNAPTTQYGNRLNILVEPPGQSSELFEGTMTIAGVSGDNAQGSFDINVTSATLKCNEGDDCLQFEECVDHALGFVVVVTGCSTASPFSCAPMYPHTMWLAVKRSTQLCQVEFGIGGGEQELPWWWWIILICLLVFLCCLAWLVYRFWWSQKKTAEELGTAEDELDQQHADNEAGFGKDLDVGDVAFNPMATGVPGMNRPADAFGNELHQRELEQQNDMVDVQAEVFHVREEYGQVATDQQRRGY